MFTWSGLLEASVVGGNLHCFILSDIVLMRVGSGMHLTGPVSVLYVAEESGKSVWKEYPGILFGA